MAAPGLMSGRNTSSRAWSDRRRPTRSSSSSRASARRGADRPGQDEIPFHGAGSVVLHRVQVQLVTRQCDGPSVGKRPELDADAPILVIDVEGGRGPVQLDGVEYSEGIRVVAGATD